MDIDSTDETRPNPTDADVEATLRDVRAFLDDPVALLERALLVVRDHADSFLSARPSVRPG